MAERNKYPLPFFPLTIAASHMILKASPCSVDQVLDPKSEEDLALKQQLELYLERIQDVDPGLEKVALESMRVASSVASSSGSLGDDPESRSRGGAGQFRSAGLGGTSTQGGSGLGSDSGLALA